MGASSQALPESSAAGAGRTAPWTPEPPTPLNGLPAVSEPLNGHSFGEPDDLPQPPPVPESWQAGSEDTQTWSPVFDDEPGPASPPAPAPGWNETPEPSVSESVVPDSWFAGPRVPDPRQDDPGPERWTPQPDNTAADGWNPAEPYGPHQQQAGNWADQGTGQGFAAHQSYEQPYEQPYGQGHDQSQGQGPGHDQAYDQVPMGHPAEATQAWSPHQPAGPAPHQPGWGPAPQQGETALLDQGFGPAQAGGPPPGPGFHPGMGFEQGAPGYPDAGVHPAGPVGYPRHAQPAGPTGGKASRPLVIGVGALVVVALLAVVIVAWPKGGADPAPPSPSSSSAAAVKSSTKPRRSGPAHDQAVAVNALLNESGASRGELGRALALSRKCKDLPAAIAGMQRVQQQRQRQVSAVRTLKVDALTNGVRLRTTLARSLNYSLQVDQAYLAWAQGAQGCKRRPKPDANHRRGAVLSNRTSVIKNQFVALWTPVARAQGLRPRTATQF